MIYIHIESRYDAGESIARIKGRDPRKALHICADRIIKVYGSMEEHANSKFGKREEDFSTPWPTVHVTLLHGKHWEALETLTASDLWDEISD